MVLSGEGSSFCAGLDFSSFTAMAGGGNGGGNGEAGNGDGGNPGSMAPGRITHLGQQVCWVWQELPVPVIAAVHGHALGGGIQIALGADIRIVHPDTQLSVRGALGARARHDRHADAVAAGSGRHREGARVHRPRVRRARGTRDRSGHQAERHTVRRRDGDGGRDRRPQPRCGARAKQLINGLLHEHAASQFEAERRIIGSLIGKPNQVEAVMSNFEKRAANFVDA
ncbi:MAG: enoyl-CoA hydratase-related protein [Ilumatobacteraceae bacterium]